MKNKAVTYLLGIVGVAVWGLIIYRITDATSGGDEDNNPPVASAPKKEIYNDYTIQKDTEKLLLNYRDPFGLVKSKDTAEIPVKKLIHRATVMAAAKPAFNWSFIQYSGYIRNPSSKKVITLMTINGKNEMFSDGDSKEQVRLLKNMRDSVKISYDGKIKFITLKN